MWVDRAKTMLPSTNTPSKRKQKQSQLIRPGIGWSKSCAMGDSLRPFSIDREICYLVITSPRKEDELLIKKKEKTCSPSTSRPPPLTPAPSSLTSSQGDTPLQVVHPPAPTPSSLEGAGVGGWTTWFKPREHTSTRYTRKPDFRAEIFHQVKFCTKPDSVSVVLGKVLFCPLVIAEDTPTNLWWCLKLTDSWKD